MKKILFSIPAALMLLLQVSFANKESVDVDSPPPCHTLSISGTHLDCYGDNDASVTVVINGGIGPYRVTWSTGLVINSTAVKTHTINNLTAGYYDVYILDLNTGCSAFALFNVTEPNLLESSLAITNVSCNGGSNGTIINTVTGGTSPYSYAWSPSGTTQNLTNRPAGTYTVTVTDSKGCQAVQTATITEPPQALGSSYTTTPVSCNNGSDASIDMSVWGGTPPYTYNWNAGTFFTQDLFDIPAGNYSVLIRDSKNCENSHTINIANPPLLVMSSTSADNDCWGDTNGEISLNVVGGTPPYIYTWANSSFMLSYDTPIIDELENNSYYVSVTDSKGCEITDSFSITSPEKIELVITGENVSAFGGTDGQIYLSVSGGIPPYIFIWSNGVSTQNNPNVPAGLYTVDVIDQNGCEATASITIQEPLEPLGFSYITRNITCNGGSDGQIFTFATGGVPPYSYLWSTGDTLSYLDMIPAGTYIMTVTDANSITFVDSVVITEPDPFSFSYTSSSPSCFGLSDGSIDFSVIGGTEPYYYQWYNGDYALAGTSEDLNNIMADNYIVIVTDTFGCTQQYALSLNQPELLVSSISGNDIECSGETTGSVTLTVEGGTPPYTFIWSNSSTTQNLDNVEAGTYSVTISDSNGCLSFNQVTLSEPSPVSIELTSYPVSCRDQQDGYIISYVTGGSGGYSYFWNTGETTPNIEHLSGGEYILMVTDIFDCSVTDTTHVDVIDKECISLVNTFTPNSDGINDTWIISNSQLYPNSVMQIFNKWGNLVFESKGYPEPWDGTYEGEILPSGPYYFIYDLGTDTEVYTGTITIVK
jgi:gliding motility-associated-like protein